MKPRHPRTRGLRRLLVATLTASLAPLAASPARATPPPVVEAPVTIPPTRIGFSKLLVRIDGRDEIGLASADFHIRLIERMRAKGFRAVGAENLLFDKDERMQELRGHAEAVLPTGQLRVRERLRGQLQRL